MADKETKPSTKEQSSDSDNGRNQIDDQANGFVNSCNRILNDLRELVEQGKWFNFLLYSGFLLTLLFSPGLGFLYPIIEKFIENSSIINPNLYNFLFVGVIFFLFFLYLILKIIEVIKHSRKGAKLFLSIFALSLVLIVFNLSFVRFDSIPGEIDDRLSSGEESLFERSSPESLIYKSNRKALSMATSPFNRPLKVATSLPINWVNGVFNAKEILRGIAIAQQQWNENPEHKNSQIVVVVADDGYENSDDEVTVAKDVAEELVRQDDILGVVGHFSSAATEAAAGTYQDNNVVVISPTSTAVRCDSNSEQSDDCLKLNEFVFRTALNEEKVIENLLRYINQKFEGDLKIAIIYEENDPYSRLYKNIFLRQTEGLNGIEVVNPSGGVDTCDASALQDFDPSPCFEKYIKSRNVNALLLIPSTKNNVWVERVLELNRANDYALLGSDSMYQESFIKINGKTREETEGMLISLSWHRSVDNESICNEQSFELECRAASIFSSQNLDEFRPLGINWRTATGYDAAQALFYAIEDTASNNCMIQKYFGRRSACIKTNLQANLSNINISEDDEASQGSIKFVDGERDGINGVIVTAAGGSFSIAPDSNS
jgi:ABC-type branched-subunit amino acid transport system substrate-binding protein